MSTSASEQAHAALVKAREAYETFVLDMTRLNGHLRAIADRLYAEWDTAIDHYEQCLRDEIEPDPPSAELLPASVPSSSQPVPLSPARPQEGGVPTHQCTKFGMCEGCGSCYCGRYVRDELEGVPV